VRPTLNGTSATRSSTWIVVSVPGRSGRNYSSIPAVGARESKKFTDG
jgi:hypothetical protein